MEHIPEVYTDFRQKYPDIAKSYDALTKSCHEDGALDAKTRHLVKLGIAIGINSEGAVRSHARQALENGGCSPDELRHAVLMALTTSGFPYMIAAMRWVETVIAESEK
jgi:4-carboxymuconolactone decarboxylase